MGLLDGKTVLITGCAQGMGRHHVVRCLAEGALVVGTDLREPDPEGVLTAAGDRLLFVQHDVTDPDGWTRVVDAALARFGAIHGLVNNAAVYHGPKAIGEETYETFEHTMRVNVTGTWWGITKVIEPMRAAGGGSIVNISSTAGIQGPAGFTSYGTSKWAVRGLTKCAASDLGALSIRVNSVHPGGTVGTGMYPPPANDREADERALRLPLRRLGTMDDISAMVIFLLSDASSFITGVEHIVDGGSVLG